MTPDKLDGDMFCLSSLVFFAVATINAVSDTMLGIATHHSAVMDITPYTNRKPCTVANNLGCFYLIGPLECDRQQVYPVTFQVSLLKGPPPMDV